MLKKRGEGYAWETIIHFLIVIFTVTIILLIIYMIFPNFFKETLGLSSYLSQFGVMNKTETSHTIYNVPPRVQETFTIITQTLDDNKDKKDCLIKMTRLPEMDADYTIRLTTSGSKLVVTILDKTNMPVDPKLGRKEFDNMRACVVDPIKMQAGSKSPVHYDVSPILIRGSSSIQFSSPKGTMIGKLNNVDSQSEYQWTFIYRDGQGNPCFMVLEKPWFGTNAWSGGAVIDDYRFNDDLAKADFFNKDSKFYKKLCNSI